MKVIPMPFLIHHLQFNFSLLTSPPFFTFCPLLINRFLTPFSLLLYSLPFPFLHPLLLYTNNPITLSLHMSKTLQHTLYITYITFVYPYLHVFHPFPNVKPSSMASCLTWRLINCIVRRWKKMWGALKSFPKGIKFRLDGQCSFYKDNSDRWELDRRHLYINGDVRSESTRLSVIVSWNAAVISEPKNLRVSRLTT